MVIEYERIKERLENKEMTNLSDKEIKMYLKLVEWASVGRVDYWNRLTKEEK